MNQEFGNLILNRLNFYHCPIQLKRHFMVGALVLENQKYCLFIQLSEDFTRILSSSKSSCGELTLNCEMKLSLVQRNSILNSEQLSTKLKCPGVFHRRTNMEVGV